MKKAFINISFFLFTGLVDLHPQVNPDIEVYLLTCAPGTETYSIYGHSALRIVMPQNKFDQVYNWGVFDFSTKNFAWKFAKGRLNYILDDSSYNLFLEGYFNERRSVYSQKINLDFVEKERLFALIMENLKPENIAYRYDFFYDDCSTRIRDLIEKAVGNKLIYPPDGRKGIPTFREKTGEYQKFYPWLNMGIDLIMGTPGEKKALFRDRMFLPLDLQKNLSKTLISRDNKMIPLLQPSESVLEFSPPVINNPFYTTPVFVFMMLFIGLIFISAFYRRGQIIKIVDIIIFSVFSILAVLMIFFNFFTDHQQMKWNLNIIWFNPFIIFCLFCLLSGKTCTIWFKIAFFLSVIFLPLIIILPQAINSSFVPIILILVLRSSARGKFTWNPLSIEEP
jgi:hypothetical protein